MPGGREPEKPGTVPSTQDKLRDSGVPLAAVHASELPTVDPAHYAERREHARGGLGRIVVAHDRRLDRSVALKELLLAGPSQEARFVREALITARLQHPGIVPVYEAGRWPDGEPFYAMKMVSGRSLRDLIDEARTLEQRLTLVPNVLAVADAVGYAHHEGIIHRDLKPSNVVVGGFGETVVVDWGLAKDLSDAPEAPEVGAYGVVASDLTVTGAVMGTPEYMPPEQAAGDPVDQRADVYALGAILYHLMTGRAPFSGESSAAVLECVRKGPPPPLGQVLPSAPPDLVAIVGKAMARDPGKRYAAAREMAEDLRRFQTGQLVAAYRYSAPERLRRWFRRYRGAAATAAIGVLAAGILLGLWLRARWTASEGAMVAQRFGQEVERIDGVLRQAYLLPLHDIRPEKALVRKRMTEIEGAMGRSASMQGPGHHALGRAHLALQEYQRAREQLEAAQTAGYRPPELDFALGQALGGLYQEALATVDRISDPALRASRRQDLDVAFRQPALRHLEASAATVGGSAAYAQGLIAFYDRRFDDALRKAEEARAGSPGMYEAWQLQGDALAARARAEGEKGTLPRAYSTFEAAGAAYRSGMAIARSHPGLPEAECRRLVAVAVHESDHGASVGARFQSATEACALALQADPEDVAVLTTAAFCHGEWAESLLFYGKDPGQRADEAADFAARAIRLDPRHGPAHAYLGEADLVRARWSARQGVDPRPLLDRAVASFRESLALEPQPETYNALGRAYKVRALFEQGHGVDPRPSSREGVASYEQALRLKPGHALVYNNLGNQWELIAEYEIKIGQDPRPSASQAVNAYERALAVDTTVGYVHNNLGTAYWCRGAYELFRGLDPTTALERAIASYERASVLDPGFAPGYVNAGQGRRMIGLYLLGQGVDPSPPLGIARARIRQALRIDPGLDVAYVEAAEVELLAARWAAHQHLSPDAAFADALRLIERGAALNRQNADFARLEAELHRWRAEWRLLRKESAASDLSHGLADAQRALGINPESAEALGIRGVLQVLSARTEAEPRRRAQWARESSESLEKALATNGLLQRDYGPFLDEARRSSEPR